MTEVDCKLSKYNFSIDNILATTAQMAKVWGLGSTHWTYGDSDLLLAFVCSHDIDFLNALRILYINTKLG